MGTFEHIYPVMCTVCGEYSHSKVKADKLKACLHCGEPNIDGVLEDYVPKEEQKEPSAAEKNQETIDRLPYGLPYMTIAGRLAKKKGALKPPSKALSPSTIPMDHYI